MVQMYVVLTCEYVCWSRDAFVLVRLEPRLKTRDLVTQVPATREVLGSLPNVFSALCLNTRGLQAFVECRPFDRLFKVLLSPDYLAAMRRRRSQDPLGE